jgi:hypothetical protein
VRAADGRARDAERSIGAQIIARVFARAEGGSAICRKEVPCAASRARRALSVVGLVFFAGLLNDTAIII